MTKGQRNTRENKDSHASQCPVCGSKTQCLLKLAACDILSCPQCTHQFADLAPTENHIDEQYNDRYFKGGGTSGYEDYVASGSLIRAHGTRYAELMGIHSLAGRTAGECRLMDIGCAAGFLMSGFKHAGWDVTGIDPNATMVALARSNGFRAYQGTLETLRDDIRHGSKNQQYDLISLIQVIAHLTDLERSKESLAALVKDNGFALIETWNCRSMTARLLGPNWHEYSPPNVMHYFSKPSLDRFMDDAGFSPTTGGRPSKTITMGHARSLFRYKYGNTRWGRALLSASRLFKDDFSVPYPSEDLFWRLYQKRS
ncbi:MAG: class I SAM-dependent methyltransferase [Burkholderiaceae bacterium]